MLENNDEQAGGQAEERGGETGSATVAEGAPAGKKARRRQEKVGLVTSDKMQKTVVVRVERLVRHPKYKRYVRHRSKFMAHDEVGAHLGDIVRIVETRPLSARKRWRVIEIVQKAT
jgi:small subunit ribosomal protein S17